MKRYVVMLQKEMRESMWYLLSGLLLFVALPHWPVFYLLTMVDDIDMSGFYTDKGTNFVLGLGAVFAGLVGIGIVCRDLHDQLENFWRSRPISIWLVVGIKYVVGLTIVIVVTASALVCEATINWMMQPIVNRALSATLTVLFAHSFTLLVSYSLAFMLGSVVRKPVRAMVLAVAGGLIIYFLPLLMPSLSWANVLGLIAEHRIDMWGMYHWEADEVWAIGLPWLEVPLMLPRVYGPFMSAMVLLSAAMLIAAYATVRYQWRLNANDRVVSWSLGGVALLLLYATAGQLGNNIDSLYRAPVPEGDAQSALTIIDLQHVAGKGVAVAMREQRNGWYERRPKRYVAKCDLTGATPRFETFFEVGRISPRLRESERCAWSSQRPRYVYMLDDDMTKGLQRKVFKLVTVDLQSSTKNAIVHTLDLSAYLPDLIYDSSSRHLSLSALYCHGDALYFKAYGGDANKGPKLIRFDISQPNAPKFVDAQLIDLSHDPMPLPKQRMGLLPLPDMSARQRLDATMAMRGYTAGQTLAGDLWFDINGLGLSTFRFTKITDTYAEYEQMGELRFSALEKYYSHGAGAWQALYHDGLLYGVKNSGVMVYDVTDLARPRRVRHYVAHEGRFRQITLMPNGNLLLAGRQVHIIAPPTIVR